MYASSQRLLIRSVAFTIVCALHGGVRADPPLQREPLWTVALPLPDSKLEYYFSEPHIAADPENSERILVGAMIVRVFGEGESAHADAHVYAWQSENGGKSWSKPIAPLESLSRPNGRGGADPVVAFATRRVCWFLGLDSDPPVPGHHVYHAIKVNRSEDGGKTWKSPIALDEFASDSKVIAMVDKPWLAIDTSSGERRGTLYVAWTRLNYTNNHCELWSAALRPGQDRFAPNVLLEEPIGLEHAALQIHQIQLTVRSNGTLDAIWRVARTGQIVHAYSKDGAATFSKPRPIAVDAASGSGQFPSLTATPDGKLLAAWGDQGNVYCSVNADDHWSAPYRMNGDSSAKVGLYRHSVAATVNALWIFTYRTEKDSECLSVVLFRSDDQGKTWSQYQILATRDFPDGNAAKFKPGDYVGLAAAKDYVYAAYVLPGEGSQAKKQLYVSAIRPASKQ